MSRPHATRTAATAGGTRPPTARYPNASVNVRNPACSDGTAAYGPLYASTSAWTGDGTRPAGRGEAAGNRTNASRLTPVSTANPRTYRHRATRVSASHGTVPVSR
jgi:hypothetical protein